MTAARVECQESETRILTYGMRPCRSLGPLANGCQVCCHPTPPACRDRGIRHVQGLSDVARGFASSTKSLGSQIVALSMTEQKRTTTYFPCSRSMRELRLQVLSHSRQEGHCNNTSSRLSELRTRRNAKQLRSPPGRTSSSTVQPSVPSDQGRPSAGGRTPEVRSTIGIHAGR